MGNSEDASNNVAEMALSLKVRGSMEFSFDMTISLILLL